MASVLVVPAASARSASADSLVSKFWFRSSFDHRSIDLPLFSKRNRCLADSVPNAADPASRNCDVYSLRLRPLCSVGLGQYQALFLGLYAHDGGHLGDVPEPMAPAYSLARPLPALFLRHNQLDRWLSAR